MLDVFVRCGAPFLNIFNVTLKDLDMFNVNSFFHLHSFSTVAFIRVSSFLC